MLRTFLIVFVALVGLRMLLPIGVRAYVDRQLDRIPEYEARIGDLDLNLWRGAYELEDVQLFKEGRPRTEPAFFETARLDLGIHWGALLRGRVVGTAVLHRPALRFVLAEKERRSQTGVEASWRERVDALFPFRIDRFAARDGELSYEALVGDRTVDLYLTDVYLEARNLTNIRDTDRELAAEAEAAGRPFGTGELEAVLVFDPSAEEPRFELDAEVRKVLLTDLNDYLQAYGAVDAEDGVASFYAEILAADGRFDGYVKTFLEGVEVLSFREIEDPGEALEALWEGFVSVAAEVLENQPYDRLATRVPLEGSLDDFGPDMWATVGSLLRNAFIEALRPVLDRSLELERTAATSARGSSR